MTELKRSDDVPTLRRRGSDDDATSSAGSDDSSSSSSGSDDSSSSSSGSDDSSSSSGSSGDDDIVIINGVPVKLRGDGTVDDSRPTGLTSTSSGFKLRGDGSIDDSQPGVVRIVGTRRDDSMVGTGISREWLRGRRGKDDFVLGSKKGSFYLKSSRRAKDVTFAIIEDFQSGDDVVLHGDRSEYRFAMSKRGGEVGLGIFHKGNKGDDLVALLAGKDTLGASRLDFIG